MIICCIKIFLDPEAADDAKGLTSLCQKLTSRFHMNAAFDLRESTVVATFLTKKEVDAHSIAEKILKVCEESGLGRIVDDQFFVDDVDNLFLEE